MSKPIAPKGNFIMNMPVAHPTYTRVGRYEGVQFFVENRTLVLDTSASTMDCDAFMSNLNAWLREETA